MKIKNTKIIATIGPASWDYGTLKQMALEGMDIARLNFSHGTHQEKAKQIKTIRKISQQIKKPLQIIADLPGPKLRLGDFEDTYLKAGQQIQLSNRRIGKQIPLQFNLAPYVKVNQRILINDGLVELIVTKVKNGVIYCKVQNEGKISSRKGVNIPDTNLSVPALSQKDEKDAQFALKAGVDFLALSFVQTKEDIQKGREIISKNSSNAKIIAKLERPQAITNLEEIIKESDMLMVARGDLAIETEATRVPILQKKIIKLSHEYSKPVIVATQMLESMVENPRPTRAEVSDVANAIFDKADCVMLSAETASGKYPVEVIKMMTKVIQAVESELGG